MTDIPNATTFTTAPLRNRLRVELDAPVAEVWALVGDLPRFPEYSSGLERVDTEKDASGAPAAYVCHFKPVEEGGEGIVHRERILWYEPNRGYASSDGNAEGNAFGATNDYNEVTVEPSETGTLLKWDMYYDARDLGLQRASLDEALADIGENVVRRFGGRVVERYVDGN